MQEERPHILVVDDDNRLRELLRKFLSENGFRVTTAADSAEARAHLGHIAFDLLILDVMMPGESGLDLAAALRRDSAVPILMLTAMGEPEDRIAGLELGADDYLPKPFEPRELVARIRSVLRRAAAEPPIAAATGEVSFGAFRFDLDRAELSRQGAPVKLTETEARLLVILARHAGRTFSREELQIEVGGAEAASRTIDVQVTRLRRKIEPDPKIPRYLQTVRGTGYVLRPD
jgi:two-component system phosphate regulon response regulator OmpR